MINILTSTYGKSHPQLAKNLQKLTHKANFTVIHQCPDKATSENLSKLLGNRYFTSDIPGLSKSRNLAIANTKLKNANDICIIADDDISYVDDFDTIITKAFAENPDTDIITFRIITPENKPFKKYKPKSFSYNKFNIFKASSIEMAFRLSKIQAAEIKFNEDFGLKAKYTLGEEAIFLKDALNAGLKAIYLPINIVYHPAESTGSHFNKATIEARGAQLACIFGYLCFIFDILFFAKTFARKKGRMNPIFYLKHIFKGSNSYLMIQK